jgi:hypothetical protein
MKFISLLLLFIISSVANSHVVVVVAKNNPLNVLGDTHIADIFLSRTNRFPNGDKAIPIELTNLTLRNNFYRSITGKSPNQLAAYWTTLVFTGRGRPPKGYQNIKQLIYRLEHQPGAIAYIDNSQVTDDLKVVYRFSVDL